MINTTEIKNINQFIPQFSHLDQLEYIPGIWMNGKTYWLQNCTEKVIYNEAVIMNVKQEQLHSKIHLFHHFLSNHTNEPKTLKVLGMHHFSNASKEQFTFAAPTEKVIYHLVQDQIFLVNGECDGIGIKEYTIQPYWNVFTNQLWSIPEKGCLKYQPLAKGHCASVFALNVMVEPHKTLKLSTWHIKGKTKNEVVSLNHSLLKNRLAFQIEK